MPPTHPEIALIPYLRGELDAGERADVARHLAQCPQCRESADSFAALLAQLPSRIDELPAPEWTAYRAELRRKLAAREEAHPWRRAGTLWASLVVGSALAAVLLLSFLVPWSAREAPPMEQFAMEQQIGSVNVDMLRDYPVLEHLDLLENYDVIEHLHELTPPAGHNESRS